jgi:hypothetical protein
VIIEEEELIKIWLQLREDFFFKKKNPAIIFWQPTKTNKNNLAKNSLKKNDSSKVQINIL